MRRRVARSDSRPAVRSRGCGTGSCSPAARRGPPRRRRRRARASATAWARSASTASISSSVKTPESSRNPASARKCAASAGRSPSRNRWSRSSGEPSGARSVTSPGRYTPRPSSTERSTGSHAQNASFAVGIAVDPRADHETERGAPLDDEVGERVAVESRSPRSSRRPGTTSTPSAPRRSVHTSSSTAIASGGRPRRSASSAARSPWRASASRQSPVQNAPGSTGPAAPTVPRAGVDARPAGVGASVIGRVPSPSASAGRGWSRSARNRSAASSRTRAVRAGAPRLVGEERDVLGHDRADVVGDGVERAETDEHLEREAAAAAAAQAPRRASSGSRPSAAPIASASWASAKCAAFSALLSELRPQPAAERAHVEHGIAVGLEHRTGPGHGVVVPADVHGEPPGGRGGTTAAHRRVDHVHARRRGRRRDLAALVGADGRVQGEDAAGRHPREHAGRPERHLADRGTVGDADPDDVARATELHRIGGERGPLRERHERLGPARPERRRDDRARSCDRPSRHPGCRDR